MSKRSSSASSAASKERGRPDLRRESRLPAGDAASAVAGDVPSTGGWRAVLVAVTVFVAVFLAFLPALRNGFVDWDDPDNFLKNPHYRGLGLAQLRWMFTTFHMGHYQPLSWVTLGLDYLWSRAAVGDGLDPRGYHLTNNLLHAANAVLAYLLVLRLLGVRVAMSTPSRPWLWHAAAALAALLFAVHPLRVESVAWLTERRDVLSSFFLLLTVLCYLRAQRRGGGTGYVWWIVVAVLMYALSLLSRAMGVTLPLILLLLDWYPLQRLAQQRGRQPARRPCAVLLEKVPFAVLAAAAAAVAPVAQRAAGATASLERHGIVARLAQGCYGLVFYLWKTFIPLDLSPIYEMRLPIKIASAHYVVPIVLVLIALAALGLLAVRGRGRAILVAAACYVVLILPVSGLVQSGNQEVADRYSYVPSLTLIVLVAAGVLRVWQAGRTPRGLKVGLGAAGGGVLLVVAVLTWRQCGVWYSTATLWEHAVHVAPNSSIAQNGYGWVLLDQKRYDAALMHLRQAVALQPANDKAHNNIWEVLQKQGKTDELIEAYRDSIRVYPNLADAHYNLGRALHNRGALDQASAEYGITLRLKPNHSKAHASLAQILALRGAVAEALQHYELAIQADPKDLLPRRNLARLLKQQNRTSEALAQLQAVLRIDPRDERARQLLEQWTAAPAGTPRLEHP